jgi:hypothetical protein
VIARHATGRTARLRERVDGNANESDDLAGHHPAVTVAVAETTGEAVDGEDGNQRKR